MAPSAGANVQKKLRRPTLPPTLVHAHAFAAIPTPGASGNPPIPSSASSSYFPLPTPPAPLRSFTLAQSEEPSGSIEPSSSYPISVTSGQQGTGARSARLNDDGKRETTNSSANPASKHSSASSKCSEHRQSQSNTSGHRFEFASATPFSAGSPLVSSSSGKSARSALSIAEIDCFFVHGSRSSVYSTNSHSSSRSRVSESGGGSMPLSELAVGSSNDDLADRETWASDESERERQRAERRAFMKARQSMREETRRIRKQMAGEPSTQPNLTWREAAHAQARTEAARRRFSEDRGLQGCRQVEDAVGSAPVARDLAQPTGQVALADTPETQPFSPSGPGPPDNPTATPSVDGLVADLSSMVLSLPPGLATTEGIQESMHSDGIPPPLDRFDSNETAVGTASTTPT